MDGYRVYQALGHLILRKDKLKAEIPLNSERFGGRLLC
jgi:hypothetical protein